MKLRLIGLWILALASSVSIYAGECVDRACSTCIDCPPLCIDKCTDLPLHGKTFLLPRSQGVNIARDLVGWHRFINRCDEPGWYWHGMQWASLVEPIALKELLNIFLAPLY